MCEAIANSTHRHCEERSVRRTLRINANNLAAHDARIHTRTPSDVAISHPCALQHDVKRPSPS